MRKADKKACAIVKFVKNVNAIITNYVKEEEKVLGDTSTNATLFKIDYIELFKKKISKDPRNVSEIKKSILEAFLARNKKGSGVRLAIESILEHMDEEIDKRKVMSKHFEKVVKRLKKALKAEGLKIDFGNKKTRKSHIARIMVNEPNISVDGFTKAIVAILYKMIDSSIDADQSVAVIKVMNGILSALDKEDAEDDAKNSTPLKTVINGSLVVYEMTDIEDLGLNRNDFIINKTPSMFSKLMKYDPKTKNVYTTDPIDEISKIYDMIKVTVLCRSIFKDDDDVSYFRLQINESTGYCKVIIHLPIDGKSNGDIEVPKCQMVTLLVDDEFKVGETSKTVTRGFTNTSEKRIKKNLKSIKKLKNFSDGAVSIVMFDKPNEIYITSTDFVKFSDIKA